MVRPLRSHPMLFAAVTDTPYKVMLLLHILSAMVAFAPSFVNPFIVMKMEGETRNRALETVTSASRKLYAPALALTGLLGFGVAGMSDDVYKVSQGWLIAAVLLWIAMNGIVRAVVLPGERAIVAGDRSAEKRVAAGGSTISVLLIVMLWLMIFKPGWP